MAYLSNAELAAMRAHALTTLPDTCSVVSYSETQDSGGRLTQDASGTVTACCRYAAGEKGWTQLVGEKPQAGNAGVFSLEGTLSLNLTDSILYGGKRYYIRGTNTNDSERMLTRVAVEAANG